LRTGRAYREDDVDKVHDAQDDGSDAHVVVSIGEEEERGREEVVGEHLRIVFALLLNVDDQDLLDPEAPLHQVIPLEDAVDLAEGPAFPNAVQVQPEVGVVHDVLETLALFLLVISVRFTYHAQRP
jgi:hypothetical protein